MRAMNRPDRLSTGERLNFLLTNRLPRRALTLFIGRFSKIENPVVARLSIGVWRLFADDLRLDEAREPTFRSMHACFTRALRDGVRPVHPGNEVLTSPCDAVVGCFGEVNGLEVIQAKGFPYTLDDLLGDTELAARYRDGRYVTLRLKSSMYHRFHAPVDGCTDAVRYIAGDTWNVNPVALRVVERLFCKNERVVFPLTTARGDCVSMVAVAAILVASVRIHGLPYPLDLRYGGPNRIAFDRRYAKGEEMGYFEHGSTIVLLTPPGYDFVPGIKSGEVVRMGNPLMRHNGAGRPLRLKG